MHPATWLGRTLTAPLGCRGHARTAWQARAGTDYRFVNPWLNVFLTVITCGIFGFYLFYQLVRRSRDHNRRRLELLDGATTFAWDEANRQGIAEELRPGFERIAVHLQPLRAMTTDFRDPAIWLLIALAAIYARLGQPLPESDPARVKLPDNYVGRIVATILTCGFYTLWWWVDQQRDGDAHYAQNWPWEDGLAQAVQNIQAA